MALHEAEIQVVSNRWHEANAWDHEMVRGFPPSSTAASLEG